MTQAQFADCVACMAEDRPPRVWSFLVTVFGDLAQAKGARLSGTALRRIAGAIGVKPEATRVALHRLGKEGWIDSRRNGRRSEYGLTDWGRDQCAAANPQIYRPAPPPDDAWLILTDPAQSTPDTDDSSRAVGPHMRITPLEVQEEGVFCVALSAVHPPPTWMTQRVCDPHTVDLAQRIASRLEKLRRLDANPAAFTALEIAVLRAVIVHGWRRVALKTPNLPDYVFPPGWRGAACRKDALALLAKLPAPPLDDLEQV